MIHVEPRHLEELRRILRENAPLSNACVFGSRARGDHRPGSDLDLLLRNTSAVPLSVIARLETAFSDSDLPFKVDMVDWHLISDDFRKKISGEMIPLD